MSTFQLVWAGLLGAWTLVLVVWVLHLLGVVDASGVMPWLMLLESRG